METGQLSGLVNGDVDSSDNPRVNRRPVPDLVQVRQARPGEASHDDGDWTVAIDRIKEETVEFESAANTTQNNVVTGRLSDVLAAEISNDDNVGAEIDLGAAVNVVHVSQLNDDISDDDNLEGNDFANDSDWESRPLRSGRHREPKKRCKDCHE